MHSFITYAMHLKKKNLLVLFLPLSVSVTVNIIDNTTKIICIHFLILIMLRNIQNLN